MAPRSERLPHIPTGSSFGDMFAAKNFPRGMFLVAYDITDLFTGASWLTLVAKILLFAALVGVMTRSGEDQNFQKHYIALMNLVASPFSQGPCFCQAVSLPLKMSVIAVFSCSWSYQGCSRWDETKQPGRWHLPRDWRRSASFP